MAACQQAGTGRESVAVSDLVVRPARPPDGAAIAEIVIAGWRAAYQGILDAEYINSAGFEAARRQQWDGFEGDRPGSPRILVAETGHVVIGWASYGEPRNPEGPNLGELWGLYVDPDHWGSGAAAALTERVLRDLAPGFAQAMLWALQDNPRARAFYAKAGFADTGRARLRDFGEAGTATEVEMVRPLTGFGGD